MPNSNGKLLLVDDKHANLLALRAVLENEGYELHEALSGSEALSLAGDHDFMAVLLDVQMPQMDGFQTARLIRQGPRNQKTPILFVTAIHRNEDFEQRGYGAGAVDFLFKPVNTEILKAKLSVFHELHRHQKEIHRQAELLHEKSLREKENQFLKESLQARDQFLSMASHELKTPITPLNLQMQAFLKMIEDGSFQSADPERLKRMLMNSHTQIERLSKTIDDLLDVSRFTTGHLQLHFEAVDLTQLVEKVLNAFKAQLRQVGCETSLQIEKNVVGHWDPFRIEQIFINILSNAMKYGAGKPIEVLVGERKGKAYFHIKDHGIGIAKEDQSRIFNRFERAVSSEFYSGLGLGLYISCEIARLHHGSIHVESALGEGACFQVSLPLSSPVSAALPE